MSLGIKVIDKNSEKVIFKENDKSSFTVGRVEGNDLVINNTTISRAHARVLRLGKDWALVDLGSTNGTFLNENQLEQNKYHLLRAGDQVTFGECEFVINEDEADRSLPTLYVFKAEKYQGEFPISPSTDFSFGGHNATIPSNESSVTDIVFIIRQDENGLLLSCKHPTHLPSKNELLVSGKVMLNDGDRVKIEDLTFLVSYRSSEKVNETISKLSNQFTTADSPQRNKTGTDIDLPSYLQDRFGESGWEDPLERKRRSSSTVFSLDQLSEQEDRERERAGSTLKSRAELVGIQRFSSPNLESVKDEEERRQKKQAVIGAFTLTILIIMGLVLLDMYKSHLV